MHAEWGYDGVPHSKMFIVRGIAEEQYCGVGRVGKHKNRKRKICKLYVQRLDCARKEMRAA